MKQLKFQPNLMSLVLSGEKTVTWRLFDEKNLSAGDKLEFINSENKNKFAEAEIISVKEKPLVSLVDSDWAGHEKVTNPIEHYSNLYKTKVDEQTPVKIIRFKLIQ